MNPIARNTLAGPSRLPFLPRQLPAFRSHATSSAPRPSHAYIPPSSDPSSPLNSSNPFRIAPVEDKTATTTSPSDLSPEKRETIARIVRVDQAGELGANWIYRGQKWGSAMRGDHKTVKQVEVGCLSPLEQSRTDALPRHW